MRARRYALNSAIRSHPRVQALSWSAFGVAEEAVLVSTTRRGALNSAIRSHPRIQAMSWSAFGVTEEAVLVSATMLKLVRLSRVSWKRSTKIFDVEQFELQDTKIVLSKLSFEILRLYLASSKI